MTQSLFWEGVQSYQTPATIIRKGKADAHRANGLGCGVYSTFFFKVKQPSPRFYFLKYKLYGLGVLAFQFLLLLCAPPPILIREQIAVSTLSSCASHIQNRVFCALQNKIALGQ